MMKYRTLQSEFEPNSQTFRMTTPTYQLNEVTGVLEEVGEQNDFELIQSSADCALSAVLERFGFVPDDYLNFSAPQKAFIEVDEEDESMFPTSTQCLNAQADIKAEELRSKYGTYDYEKILDILKKQALDKAVEELKKQQGGDNGEKTHSRSQEQTPVREHSEEDA